MDEQEVRNKINELREQAARAWRLSIVPTQESDRQRLRELGRELSQEANELEKKLSC